MKGLKKPSRAERCLFSTEKLGAKGNNRHHWADKSPVLYPTNLKKTPKRSNDERFEAFRDRN